MKTRTAAQRTATLGVTAVQRFCDQHGFIFQAVPREDFGVDGYIEVVLEQFPRNFLLAIQIKTGPSYFRNDNESSFQVSLDRDDIEYWLASNIPVLFACYHPERDRLYFKHVQAEIAARETSPWAIAHLVFDKTQDEANSATAAYLRSLVETTPNELDRRNIAHAPIAIVTKDGSFILDRAELRKQTPQHAVVLAQCLTIDFPVSAGFLAQERWSRVLGFGFDDAWVATLVVNTIGQKCDDVYLRLLSFDEWREISFPLSTEEDYDRLPSGLLPSEVFQKRLARAQASADIRQVRPAISIHRRYDSTLLPGEPSGLSLTFGREKFTFDVKLSNGRCAVVLRADRFRPSREALIVAEQVGPGQYFVPRDGQEPWPMTRPKTFASICELSVSESGSFIAVGLLTNAEHGCWGNCDVHHVFVRTQDLRQLCIDALRT